MPYPFTYTGWTSAAYETEYADSARILRQSIELARSSIGNTMSFAYPRAMDVSIELGVTRGGQAFPTDEYRGLFWFGTSSIGGVSGNAFWNTTEDSELGLYTFDIPASGLDVTPGSYVCQFLGISGDHQEEFARGYFQIQENPAVVSQPIGWQYIPTERDPYFTTWYNSNSALLISVMNDVSSATSLATPNTLVKRTSGAGTAFDYVDFTQNPTGGSVFTPGRVRFSNALGVLEYDTDLTGVTCQIGEELYVRVKNDGVDTLADGEVVRIGTATGGFVRAVRAQADSATNLHGLLGIVTADIAPHNFGRVTVFGEVRNLNTSQYGTDGDELWVSPTTAGAMTSAKPVWPNLPYSVGTIKIAGVGNGVLLVRPQCLTELEIHKYAQDAHSNILSSYSKTSAINAQMSQYLPLDGGGIISDSFGYLNTVRPAFSEVRHSSFGRVLTTTFDTRLAVENVGNTENIIIRPANLASKSALGTNTWSFNRTPSGSYDVAATSDLTNFVKTSAISSVDFTNRFLLDSAALTAVDWDNRLLVSSGGDTATVDWKNGYLFDPVNDFNTVQWIDELKLRGNWDIEASTITVSDTASKAGIVRVNATDGDIETGVRADDGSYGTLQGAASFEGLENTGTWVYGDLWLNYWSPKNIIACEGGGNLIVGANIDGVSRLQVNGPLAATFGSKIGDMGGNIYLSVDLNANYGCPMLKSSIGLMSMEGNLYVAATSESDNPGIFLSDYSGNEFASIYYDSISITPDRLVISGNSGKTAKLLIGNSQSIENVDYVRNGGFSGSAVGWTLGAGWTYSSNTIRKIGDGVGTLSQNLSTQGPQGSLVNGNLYKLIYTISSLTVGSVTPTVVGNTLTTRSANGTYAEEFYCINDTLPLVFTPTNTARFTLDNIKINSLTQMNTVVYGNLSAYDVFTKRLRATEARIGSSTDYTNIAADGTITLAGSATVFRDELNDLTKTGVNNPSDHIINEISSGTLVYKDNCDSNDYAAMSVQINHDWKQGSAIEPHVHWIQQSATLPNWVLQYRYQANGAATTSTWSAVSGHTVFTYTSGALNQITSFGSNYIPAQYNISDIIQLRLIRDVDNTLSAYGAADTLAASVSAMSLDIHIECDSLGSSQRYIK